MARFEKGRSGNPAGRKLGTKNKRTAYAEAGLTARIEDVDGVLSAYLSGSGDAPHSLLADFNAAELTPRDRLLVAERLMEYRFPKMKSVDATIAAKNAAPRSVEDALLQLSVVEGEVEGETAGE